MIKYKTPDSVKGAKIRCPDFNPCPLCYGCRNYDPSYYKCIMTCGGNKNDVCNTSKHNDRALKLMIRRPEIAV